MLENQKINRNGCNIETVNELLVKLADKYETPDFINGDPSWFMHQVEGRRNQETMAFVASCLSYGSRRQFLPKIQMLLDFSEGEMFDWVCDGAYERDVPAKPDCFYRLYSYSKMNNFFAILRDMILEFGSLEGFARNAVEKSSSSDTDVVAVLDALGCWFAERGMTGIVPKPKTSLCKRPVMFMRWMVRDGSPVDLGLWADFIDKRNLYIPMDTHVFQMACRLGLLDSKTASWKSVETLKDIMLGIFPDDPSKGDFALFGYDVAADKGGLVL